MSAALNNAAAVVAVAPARGCVTEPTAGFLPVAVRGSGARPANVTGPKTGAASSLRQPANCASGASASEAASSGKKVGAPRRHDWDAVLDAWAAGETGPNIEARLGLKRGIAWYIITAAFNAGDQRAASRPSGPRPSGTHEWHLAAVAEWNRGDHQREIAKRHRKARSTVRGALSRLEHMLTRPLSREYNEEDTLVSLKRAHAVQKAMGKTARAQFAEGLPALIAEHKTLLAISRATGRGRQFIALAAKEAGITSLERRGRRPKPLSERKPKPARVRLPRAPRPMSEAQAIRAASPPPRPKKAPLVEVPHTDDPRIARIWAILLRKPDADPFDVMERARCELRQVYQVRAAIREMRRAA